MRSAVAGLLVALVLFVAGAAAWSQARLARSVADAHQRLATLNLDEADGIEAATTAFSLLPWPTGSSLSEDVRRHRATVAYWRSEYRQLTSALPSSGTNPGGSSADPAVMFVAANAAFRASLSDPSDRAATIELARRWQVWSAGTIFPAHLGYTLDIGGDETASRVGIDPGTSCAKGVDVVPSSL